MSDSHEQQVYKAHLLVLQAAKKRICGIVAQAGCNGEPLACAFLEGHKGAHAWASLPTFVEAVLEAKP